MPSARTISPLTSRNRSERPGRSCASRSASIGAIRAARRAGTIAAIDVTIVPTTIDTTTVRSRTTVPDAGRSTPIADRSPFSPMASPIPASTPTGRRHEPDHDGLDHHRASSPGARWRPSARNRASSRVRWATMIAKVLKMMNAPTKSATNANTRKAVRTKPRL